jgi:osmoprotectant transport system substrate-binding protein
MRFRRSLDVGAAILAVTLVVAACGSSGDDDDSTSSGAGSGGGGKSVTVASANFSENVILANMYAKALEAKGYKVTDKFNLGNRELIYTALDKGQVDIVPEYIGTALEFLNKGKGEATGDPKATADKLREEFKAKGVSVLEPSPAADQNSFAVTKATADKYSLKTMSDLAKVSKDLTLGGPPECPQRPFCIPGMKTTYGIEFKDFKSLDAGGPKTKGALEAGDIDVGLVFSSDGAVTAKNFVVLEDDKGLQTADNIVAIVRTDKLDDTITSVLNDIDAKLTTKDLQDLNKRADIDKEDPDALAEEWLKDHGFLK